MNEDTVDKVLEHLMTRGLKVAGGDRLGKTIVFAKNHAHALYIAERFDVNYPNFKGDFARVIDNQITYADSLIADFEKPAKAPHIAISVDMLDTGIDIPEVVNLVFFKMVRSKTKFWQMVGRGTRLSRDLFGPGQHKEFFYLFDYCDNLAFFGANAEGIESKPGDSLSTRLFKYRLELIEELDRRFHQHGFETALDEVRDAAEPYEGFLAEYRLRLDVTGRLRSEIEAMNVDNFVVRPQRRLVEKWRGAEAWTSLTSADLEELAHELASLPNELPSEEEEAKRFDSLLLRLQLARLQGDHRFVRLAEQLRKIAGLLEEKKNIPMIRAELPLILELQSDEWWQDTTVAMFENVRRRQLPARNRFAILCLSPRGSSRDMRIGCRRRLAGFTSTRATGSSASGRSVSELSRPSVSPRDVFRWALHDHAAAVIVFHNHPSGDPSPSPQDLAFTSKLVDVGRGLGVDVLDHIIVAGNAFVSLKQRELM